MLEPTCFSSRAHGAVLWKLNQLLPLRYLCLTFLFIACSLPLFTLFKFIFPGHSQHPFTQPR